MGEKRKRECEGRICCESRFELEQNLCNEAIEQILLHSPPSTVARFKCVSTHWRSRLSKSSFIDRYKSTNFSLLGFMYNKSCDRVRFNPVSEQSTMIDMLMANKPLDNAYCILDSSNGLQLLYFVNFGGQRPAEVQFLVRNFVSGTVTGIAYAPFLSYPSEVSIQFNVFGFYFDPYCETPNFTIVEITHLGNRMAISKFNSLIPRVWTRLFHTISSGTFTVLTGSSTFLNGSLHWLAQPSGVVGYNLQTHNVRLFLEIPGDINGICRCVEKIREAPGCYSNGDCSCRFLGEVKDKLVYIRVTGDFVLSMWVLEKYYDGEWSHARRIVIDGFPASTPSTFFGKVLGFDRKDPNVIYIRLKRTVYSYDIVKRLASALFVISKDYGGEAMIKKRATYARGRSRVIPKPFSNVPENSMPAGSAVIGNTLTLYEPCQYVSRLDRNSTVRNGYDDELLEKLRKAEDGRFILHTHIAISQIACKAYTDLNLVEDITLPPVWSNVEFKSSGASWHRHFVARFYSHIIRLESALYGFTFESDVRVEEEVEEVEEEEEEEEPTVID